MASARSGSARTSATEPATSATRVAPRPEPLIVVKEVPPVAITAESEIADALSSIASAFYAPNAIHRPKRVRDLADRTLDLVLGSVIFICTLPLLVGLMLLVRLTSQGPAVYKQVRVGRHGRLFACCKLRTMVVDADQRLASLLASRPDLAIEFAANCKLRDDPRVTRVGRFLRHTSLDELPQLINVLRGEMSLVGPRPLPPAELARYGAAITEVLGVRPGMTGPWQVSGRNDLLYEERVRLDLGFARHHSTISNLAIIARTATQVIRPNGAY